MTKLPKSNLMRHNNLNVYNVLQFGISFKSV